MKAGDILIERDADDLQGLIFVRILKEAPDANGLADCTTVSICERDGQRVFYSVSTESTIDVNEQQHTLLVEQEQVSAVAEGQ